MRTIILAAGQGTRLRPYTSNKPKCMVRLAGQPLLHSQMDALAECGVGNDIVIVGGYCIEALDPRNSTVMCNRRFDETNMVATLFCAREYMRPGEDLLISYSDIVYEPRVLKAVLECDAPVCLAADLEWERLWKLRMDNPLSDAETFVMDRHGRVMELGKKPNSPDNVQAQYMGLIRVRGDYVADFIAAYDDLDRHADYDGKNFDNMYMTSFIQNLIDTDWRVQACLVKNGWLEVDTVKDLRIYEEAMMNGKLDSYCSIFSSAER